MDLFIDIIGVSLTKEKRNIMLQKALKKLSIRLISKMIDDDNINHQNNMLKMSQFDCFKLLVGMHVDSERKKITQGQDRPSVFNQNKYYQCSYISAPFIFNNHKLVEYMISLPKTPHNFEPHWILGFRHEGSVYEDGHKSYINILYHACKHGNPLLIKYGLQIFELLNLTHIICKYDLGQEGKLNQVHWITVCKSRSIPAIEMFVKKTHEIYRKFNLFNYACSVMDEELIIYAINNRYRLYYYHSDSDFKNGLEELCRRHRFELIFQISDTELFKSHIYNIVTVVCYDHYNDTAETINFIKYMFHKFGNTDKFLTAIYNGGNALMWSCVRNETHILNFLLETLTQLENGTKIMEMVCNDKTNAFYCQPHNKFYNLFITACVGNELEMLQMVVKYGKELNLSEHFFRFKTDNMMNGMDIACFNLNIDIIKFLKCENFIMPTDAFLIAVKGINFHISVDGDDDPEYTTKCIDFLNTLIEMGVNEHHTDCWGNNAIHLCCKNIQMIDYFFSLDIDINHVNDDGINPFLHAVMHENLEMVEHLHSLGANINQLDNKGSNALQLCLIKDTSYNENNLDKVYFLLDLCDYDEFSPRLDLNNFYSEEGGKYRFSFLTFVCKWSLCDLIYRAMEYKLHVEMDYYDYSQEVLNIIKNYKFKQHLWQD